MRNRQSVSAAVVMLLLHCCKQGKIKGSYTPEKMLEFCRRGTLSPSQLLLGIDQNLPYLARQVGWTCGVRRGACLVVRALMPGWDA
jgi:hypothetical protein